MSDVCRKDFVTHPLSLRNEPTALSACVRARSSRATLSAYSFSFSSARVPKDSGRCSGMPNAESPDQMPCRSGSPHGVFGAEYVCACATADRADIRVKTRETRKTARGRAMVNHLGDIVGRACYYD